MNRIGIALILILLAASISAAEIVISVSDFSVETADDRYAYIGKGISTLIAGELRLSRSVRIIEREKLNQILEEQNLSLSGLVDESSEVEIGKLIAADYIVYGQIIDMVETFLISVRVTNIETGEVVWSDSIMEKLEKYDYIGAFFARGILSELDVEVQEETVVKLDDQAVKDSDALIALSSGIDAYDKGKEEKAKEELAAVRRMDPGNQVARFYLSKMAAISPKFRIETTEYVTPYTAASLGFIENDEIFLLGSMSFEPPWVSLSDTKAQPVGGDLYARDTQNQTFAGYSVPLGRKFGIGAGVIVHFQELQAWNDSDPFWLTYQSISRDGMKSNYKNIGGYLNGGWRIHPSISIGLSMLLWDTSLSDSSHGHWDAESSNVVDEGMFFGINPSFMLMPEGRNYIIEFQLSYSNQNQYYAEDAAGTIRNGKLPLIIEGSFIYGPLSDKVFLGIKGITDIYFDERKGHALRIIPMVDYWPAQSLSLRAGVEYNHLIQSDEISLGFGVTTGFTIKIKKFNFDTNLTYRHKPAKLIPGTTVEMFNLLVGFEYELGAAAR